MGLEKNKFPRFPNLSFLTLFWAIFPIQNIGFQKKTGGLGEGIGAFCDLVVGSDQRHGVVQIMGNNFY